jgi:hypothetical protein
LQYHFQFGISYFRDNFPPIGLPANDLMKDTKHCSSPSMLVNYLFMDLLSAACLDERK